MFSRLVRFVTSLAIVGTAYAAYGLLLAPWIEPAARPRVDVAEADAAPAAAVPAEPWRAMFPAGSWELDQPKVLDTDRGTLLLKDLRELDEYRLELKPCTLILFSDDGEDRHQSRPVILQASEGAVLTFDEPVNLARGQLGRLARGALPGEVTIRSPESRPGAGDQLEVVTHNVQMNRERIETAQPIRFRYGRSYGSGRDLIIHLVLPAEKRSSGGGPAVKPRAPGVSSAELVHVDRIRLQLDNPQDLAPAETASQPSAAASLELEITCQGPFKFDFDRRVATFEDQVDVIRVPTSGTVDQLSCQRLAVYFTQPDGTAAPAGPEAKPAKAAPPDLRGLKVERIQAHGTPAVVRAPTYAATLRAEVFEYNFLTRQVKIEDRQKLMLRYHEYDIEARQLEYQFAVGGRLGRLWARGPGRASGALPDKKEQTFEAAWNDRVILQPDKSEHALSLLGGGLLRLHGEGEFAARDLHVWLSEVTDPQSPRGKPRYRYLPQRMLAEGDVRVDSWQLAGAVQRAEVWIRHEAAAATAAVAAADGKPLLPPMADRKRQTGQKFDLAAEHLQTQLVRRGEETLVEHLLLDGRVQFREVRTDKAGDVPLAIAGNLVQVDDATTSAARVKVQGQPAEVAARGMTVTGDNIQLNRGDNRIWIDGPGKMLLPAPARKRPEGAEPLAAPASAQPLNVAWGGRMDFDGRTARFLRDVQVSSAQQSPQGETFDVLVLGHELAVTLNQEVNLSRDKPPQDLDVQQLAVVGGAFLQNTGSRGGNRTSYDQLQVRDLTIDQRSGRLHAEGPGWGTSVRYDRGLAGNPLNPAAEDAGAEPRLAFVRVDYDDEIEGNIEAREIEFRGRVRTLYGPVDHWDQTLDPDPIAGLAPGQYLLTSDRLAVADVTSPIGTQEAGVELTALGNATIEGDAFSARAYRVAYAKAKELVILEGDGRVDAELWRKGSSTPDFSAKQIRYWTTTQSVQVDEFRHLNLGGVETQLNLPKR